MTSPPSLVTLLRETALAVCSSKELAALDAEVNPNLRGQAAKAASLGITTRAYRYRLESAVHKIKAAWPTEQEKAA